MVAAINPTLPVSQSTEEFFKTAAYDLTQT